MAEEEEVFDGFVEQDPNFNPTPVFGFDNGNLVINAPIKNELLTTFGNIDLITPLPNPNQNNNLIFQRLK